MTLPRVPDSARFLVDKGLLFEINRQVLHPLGLELHVEPDGDGGVKELWLADNRANQGPLCFSPEAFDEGRRRYEAYMEEHGRRNVQKRRQIGMVIQTGPNLPRHIHPEDAEA